MLCDDLIRVATKGTTGIGRPANMAPVPSPPQESIAEIENHLRALRTPDEVIARHVARLRELQKIKQRRFMKTMSLTFTASE
jgi:hypothetical protein